MPIGRDGHWAGLIYHRLDLAAAWCHTCERALATGESRLDHLLRTARWPAEVEAEMADRPGRNMI